MKDKAILYIEDNFHNRRIVRKILTVNGYSVVEADDGILGLEMIRELKPPLVLLDIALPGMDGMEIAQHVKADEALRDVPLVALTASAMRGDRERFLAAGCDGYLSKPFKAHELVEVVENYYDTANGNSHVPHNGHDSEHKYDLEMNGAAESVAAETEAVEAGQEVEAQLDTEPETVLEEDFEESTLAIPAEVQPEAEVANVAAEMIVDEDLELDAFALDEVESEIEIEASVAEASFELTTEEAFETEIEDGVAEEAKAEDDNLTLEEQDETEVEESYSGFDDGTEIVIEGVVAPVENDMQADEIDVEPEVNGAKSDVLAFDPEAEADADEVLGDSSADDDEADEDYDERFVSQLIERLELSEIVPSLPELDDAEAGKPDAPLQNTGPKTILIVEDNVYDARLMRRMFESQKYTVKVIQTGEATLRYLEDNLPTAILLDLVLPDMRGEDVLGMVRANRYTAPIPVVVVSVKELDPKARQALTEQADSVWSKELLDYRALFTHVDDLIRAREAE
ncbi:MAG: response regulator [Anaerolineales bacterium]|nr:response regulator [Anaerolineales bacterium]